MKRSQRFLAALIAAAAVTLLVGLGILQRLDKWAQDAAYQRPGVSSGDIIIIGIDEDALDQLGPYNTWDRNVMASALEALAADPDKLPAAVAVDVLYAGTTQPEADERLARAAEDLGCVISATVARFGERISWQNGRATAIDSSAILSYDEPYDALKNATTQGHINAMVDQDGILRHALLYVEPESGRRVYSMAAEAARKYLERQGQSFAPPPVSGIGHYYVPFTARPGTYYDGVSIAMLISGRVPPDYWAGKVVLIGPYATALQDAYFTAIDNGSQMFGVEYQANVIQSLIEKNFKRELPDWPQLALLFLACAAVMLLFLRLKVQLGVLVSAGLALLSFGCSYLLYQLGLVTHPLWLPFGLILVFIISSFIQLVHTVHARQALEREKERIGTELALATRIQASVLPKEFPAFPDRKEFDIFASMKPAKEVGGDFYDFFLIDDDHLGLVIGDVSGKGVPAALFMMVSSSLIHQMATREKSPAEVLRIVNSQICARNPEEMFVTVWLGTLEISTGRLTAASAGHEYPALKAAGGRFELFKDRHGFVLGGMDGVRYREYDIQLEPGARLFVYTDGVAEATDANEQMFGTARMLEALRSAEDAPPQEILASVDRAVGAFVGTAPQFDDLTMLCLEYKGPDLTAPPKEAQ